MMTHAGLLCAQGACSREGGKVLETSPLKVRPAARVLGGHEVCGDAPCHLVLNCEKSSTEILGISQTFSNLKKCTPPPPPLAPQPLNLRTMQRAPPPQLHPVFTASWHSRRHITVPCGSGDRGHRLCMNCAAAYPVRNGERPHGSQCHSGQMSWSCLSCCSCSASAAPVCCLKHGPVSPSVVATLDAKAQAALPPAVASHNETTSQDGSELEFRIGLAAARLAKSRPSCSQSSP